MPHGMLTCLLLFLFIAGCSASGPPDESPNCGAPTNSETVTVVDAGHLNAEQDINAVLDHAAEQAGSFQLISNQPFRADTWPQRRGKPRWIHAQEAAASKGCDVLILVGSEMLRSQTRGGMDGPGSPTLHLYFLMGFKAP